MILDELLAIPFAPQATSPAQIPPRTSIIVPFGIVIVVPGWMTKRPPVATTISPVTVWEPLHISGLAVIVPLEVSLVAATVGNAPTKPIMMLVSIRNDKNMLFSRFFSLIVLPLIISGASAISTIIEPVYSN